MEPLIFESSRTFQVWRYAVGHGTLLIRSVRDVANPTRLDIVFVDVIALKLQTRYDGLGVRDGNADESGERIGESKLPPALVAVKKPRVFLLSESEDVGWVVAGGAGVHEDDGDYDDPSYFDVAHPAALEAATSQTTRERWLEQRNRRLEDPTVPSDWLWSQCGQCRYWARLAGVRGYDFGGCANPGSLFDDKVRFEHDGCDSFEPATDGARRAREINRTQDPTVR